MRILIVEDERALCDTLVKSLKQKGYEVDACYDGDSALDWLLTEKYDLLLLDLNLPGRDGMDLLKTLREQDRETRVLILSARSRISDKVEGLDCGANDYLVKPFENKELIARVNALGRRKGRPFVDDIYTKSGVEMNSRTGMLTAGGKELKLSRREFELFRRLFVNSGQIILRETILDKVWTDNPEISPASLDAYIYILRRKIREFSGRIRIRLDKGIGYVLEIEEWRIRFAGGWFTNIRRLLP